MDLLRFEINSKPVVYQVSNLQTARNQNVKHKVQAPLRKQNRGALMSLVFKGKMLAFGAVLAAFGVSQADKSINYIKVDATVTSAKVDCYVESGNEYIKSKDTNSLAFMDCEMAPYAAKEFGFEQSDIKKRTEFAFSYTSPVDGKLHKGNNTKKNAAYKVGEKVDLYAHKEEPEKFRF
jgi:hypothetical protein